MKKTNKVAVLALLFALSNIASANIQNSNLSSRIDSIMIKPEFRHANFGIEFYSLDNHQALYKHNADKMFRAASTTKLITCGSALQLLEPDYRFHTRVYKTGKITSDGTLEGDLILVASGDPNLSGRINNDTLMFANEDHSGGGFLSKGIGNPLSVINNFAQQISDHGIKRITGRVIIDASLFPQGEGSERTLSPIIINDNVIDILISAGEKEGDPTSFTSSPTTSYVQFINHTTTAKSNTQPTIQWIDDIKTKTVILEGSLPAGKSNFLLPYSVENPAHFAEALLVEALRKKGIAVSQLISNKEPNFKSLSRFYVPDQLVAEHISPPLSEEVKIILKVSQGLHAAIMPFLFSKLTVNGKAPQAGFDLMHDLLVKDGLNLSEASQNDGAGEFGYFTPEFMVNYLKYISTQKIYEPFLHALPILGKDGTLYDIQIHSPAAGHVFAKTGTLVEQDSLNRGQIVTAKALAGYMTTKKGNHIVFTIFASNVLINADPNSITNIVGETLGEIAASAYETL